MGENSKIKAIETVYKGYRFRSRLEARWAVFFDTCGIKYEYEPEGYEAEEIKYLPDFYLPDFDLHCEVKADTEQGRQEIINKCENIIKWGGDIKQILILSDVPEGESLDGGIWHFPCLFWKATEVVWGWWFFYQSIKENDSDCVTGHISSASYIYARYWCIDAQKSIKAVTDMCLRENTYLYKDRPRFGNTQEWIDCQHQTNRLVFEGLKKARAARFEHGEVG